MRITAVTSGGNRYWAFRIRERQYGMTSDEAQAHEFVDIQDAGPARSRLEQNHNELTGWAFEEDACWAFEEDAF